MVGYVTVPCPQNERKGLFHRLDDSIVRDPALSQPHATVSGDGATCEAMEQADPPNITIRHHSFQAARAVPPLAHDHLRPHHRLRRLEHPFSPSLPAASFSWRSLDTAVAMVTMASVCCSCLSRDICSSFLASITDLDVCVVNGNRMVGRGWSCVRCEPGSSPGRAHPQLGLLPLRAGIRRAHSGACLCPHQPSSGLLLLLLLPLLGAAPGAG